MGKEIMENQMDVQKQAYKQEAGELLGELESALLELEESPDNEDLIGRVFRAMHTIKGSGAMFGFDAIAAFTHEVEAVYDLVREGKIAVTKELINLSLLSKDLIAEMLSDAETGMDVLPEKAETVMAAFKNFVPGQSSEEPASSDPLKHDGHVAFSTKEEESLVTYRIRFRPSEDIFANGTNPLLLLKELAELGECHVVAHNDHIPLLSDMDPETCYVFWDIILTTDKGKNAIEDVFIFVSDICEIAIQVIDEDDGGPANSEYKKIGEILVERGDLSPDDLDQMLRGKKRIGEMLTEAGVVSRNAIEAALAEQEHVKKIRQQRREIQNTASLRVDADKLDVLVDLVGEMVTVQARLSQEVSTAGNGALTLIAEEVERLVNELRDNTMGIRMLPIGSTFSKFKRLVRDLSESLGKHVTLTTSGGDTELDKTILEKINDPLVHIIRNSIDHGIEIPEERVEKGKPAQGTLHITAGHEGAHVVIRVEDDGKGLDPEAIRNIAITRDILSPEAELSENELLKLIFAPGFSTAETVTSVSGRGVGMDVVKKSIQGLRGTIDVDSKKGTGTTITMELPLTLAIIEGFMVMIGDEYFVFPLASVEECVEISGKEMESIHSRNIMNIRGEVVPYRNLRKTFAIDGESFTTERVVVVFSGGQRMGFGVDRVIGQHQTVIKSLGKLYGDIKEISGATILGDGTVAMILDVGQLIQGNEIYH